MNIDTNRNQGPVGGPTLTGGELHHASSSADSKKVYQKLHGPGSVLAISLLLVVAFVLWAAIAPEQLNGLMSGASKG